MKQVVDLTCCRALFALSVFTYHVNLQSRYAGHLGPVGWVVRDGYLGVDGFFILSGIVLAYAHQRMNTSLAEVRLFIFKRLVRIYPVHVVTIGLFALMLILGTALGNEPRDPSRFGSDELLRHLLLIHAWGFSDRYAWNYPSWSISAEWAGYLVFPLLWPRLRNSAPALLVAVILLACVAEHAAVWAAVPWRMNLTYDGGLLRFYPEFIAGMATVPLVPRLARVVPGTLLLSAGVLCSAFGAMVLHDAAGLVVDGFWMILAGFMLRALQGGRPLLDWIPGARLFGELSYSFYMSFAFVETVQSKIWRNLHVAPHSEQILYGITTFAMTLSLALILWNGIEKPTQRAFARRNRTPIPVSARDVTP